MEESSIERLKGRLRSALEGSEWSDRREAIMASLEPYAILMAENDPLFTEAEKVFAAAEEQRTGKAFSIDQWRQRQREAALPMGASRFGFVPDLPPEVKWPEVDGKKLFFLAQINLGAMPRWEGNPLPAEGWLYVFILFPEHGSNECRVLHYAGPTETLVRQQEQSCLEIWELWGKETIGELMELRGRVGITMNKKRYMQLAGFEPDDVYQRGDLVNQLYDLEELLKETFPEEEFTRGHRRGTGWGDMGWLLGSVPNVDQETVDRVESRPEDEKGSPWVNLLAFSGVGVLQPSGIFKLYFFIREEDLKRGDFSRVEMDAAVS